MMTTLKQNRNATFKDVLVEVPLEGFIGIIDQELIEAVEIEAFKAKNIQDGQRFGSIFRLDCLVALQQNHIKHHLVEKF